MSSRSHCNEAQRGAQANGRAFSTELASFLFSARSSATLSCTAARDRSAALDCRIDRSHRLRRAHIASLRAMCFDQRSHRERLLAAACGCAALTILLQTPHGLGVAVSGAAHRCVSRQCAAPANAASARSQYAGSPGMGAERGDEQGKQGEGGARRHFAKTAARGLSTMEPCSVSTTTQHLLRSFAACAV